MADDDAPARSGAPGDPGPRPRQVLADSVYEAVKAMVMDHAIQPGARVGIEALARALDVSPTPVREALARLESDGLVTKRSLAGYRATELLTRAGLDELFEMRLLLEPHAAALAARNADDADLDAIENLVEQMRRHPGTGDRYAVYRDFAALDQRFHDTVAAATGRGLLADAVGRLHSHLHIFRLGSVQGGGPLTLAEHDRILRAILRRNPERAADAMRAHLTASLDRQHARRDHPQGG
ncbi:GntR family transcriptional regulator [Streptomyces sp. NPDC047002]|uniref:GntR family transcriptional regulator n=1 Tax=Streptomyces sp. NPDC047002 TaxID=3155475 RepID=UPI0034526BCF